MMSDKMLVPLEKNPEISGPLTKEEMCGELISGPPEQIHSSAHTEFTTSFIVHKHQVSPIIKAINSKWPSWY